MKIKIKRKSINKNKGFLIWVTGFSGSGKTTIGKKLLPLINKRLGNTILIHADDLINLFKLKGYSKVERIKRGLMYGKLLKFLTDKKINVIFTVVGMFNKVRENNRKLIQNYIEVFIDSDLKLITKKSKKKHYVKNSRNIIGLDIKPEFPKIPDVTIFNDFKTKPSHISKKIMVKLIKFF